MKRLHLGCGEKYEKDWINCDMSKKVKADHYFDCGKDKFPFKANSFDKIKAEMVFEHLPDYRSRIHFLKEIHRVGKNGCKIFLSMPHFSSYAAWGDLQHIRPFSSLSFDYVAINKTHKHSIMHAQEVEGENKLFFVEPKLVFGRLHKLIGISLLANWKRTRLFYEMFLTYIFPAREVNFFLTVVK